ncbi:sortase [Bifidobacterium thermophilum]|nr:sortase [Bifidobacterium thermophilum]
MYPVVLRMQSSHRLESTAHSAQHHVEQWPTSRVKAMLTAAHDYNNRLSHSPQSQLGGTDDAIDNGTLYKTYLSLLDTDNGIMGSVRVPSISVDLPIYHGTSDRVLANGAGHLYGTSLPVGGTSTHAVITGHRGLTDAEMFTRLNEMRKGDTMYLEVLGETLAYQVDAIWIINPDDTSLLRITPGEDRLTLMTCTPYGVNTQRLLVSGHRVAYPGAAPDPAAVRDWRQRFVWAITGIVITAIVALTITYRDGRWHPRRHMRGEQTPIL